MKSTHSIFAGCTSVVAALALILTQTAHAAKLPHFLAARAAAQTAPPPVPERIASGHAVFLTNAGTDPNFPIDSTQAYNDIYADLQAWGHYQLVNSAEQADLVFELHDVSPVTGVSGIRGDVESYTSPAFELTIRDARTNGILWTISSPVELAGRKKEQARWIALSEANLISRIKAVAGVPLTAVENAQLTTVPKGHAAGAVLLFLGLSGGAALAGLLLYRHAVNNGKAAQDAFCQANHIPLSECAGG